eukprot:gene4871-3492_t
MPPSYPDSRIRETLAVMKPKFHEVFHTTEADVEWLLFSFAPGRVNFYGEHVDYMGGYVCPAGLREGCHLLCGRVKKFMGDGKIRFATTKGQSTEISSVAEGEHNKNWTTFAVGATAISLDYLKKTIQDPALSGVCFISHGTLSMGSGMSASTSYGVALLFGIQAAIQESYRRFPKQKGSQHFPELPKGDRDEKITLTKQALLIETKYCGVNVGILDQFSCVHATQNNFMALDCDALTFTNHDINNITGPDSCFLLINSMVKHELTGANDSSSYNVLRSDAEGAEAAVSKVKLGGKPFKFCDCARNPKKFTQGDPVQFVADCKSHMTQGQFDRGTFNIAEQMRTIEFIRLSDPDCPLSPEERYKRAGEMLNATFYGQRDMLRISTPELNFLHEVIASEPDVAGGRIMGAGFGGCILALMRKKSMDGIVRRAQQKFQKKFNIVPEVYPVELCDGVFVASLYEGQHSNL